MHELNTWTKNPESNWAAQCPDLSFLLHLRGVTQPSGASTIEMFSLITLQNHYILQKDMMIEWQIICNTLSTVKSFNKYYWLVFFSWLTWYFSKLCVLAPRLSENTFRKIPWPTKSYLFFFQYGKIPFIFQNQNYSPR